MAVLRRDDALLLGRPPDRDRLLPPLHSQARAAPPQSALQGQVELPVPDEAAHDAGLLPLPAPPGTHRHARRRDGARPDGARRRDRRRDRGSDRQRAPRHDVDAAAAHVFPHDVHGLVHDAPGRLPGDGLRGALHGRVDRRPLHHQPRPLRHARPHGHGRRGGRRRRRHDGVPRTPLHLRDPRPRVPGPILGRVLLQRRARSGGALLQGLREAVLRLLACPFLTPARYARRPP
mmetsp:Transcript_21341/g.55710  ORF Transcript_21341/g.55710 Transcript_21341/m.55710 type:complete len:233 (+) Transcript_21341:842-1540(+)